MNALRSMSLALVLAAVAYGTQLARSQDQDNQAPGDAQELPAPAAEEKATDEPKTEAEEPKAPPQEPKPEAEEFKPPEANEQKPETDELKAEEKRPAEKAPPRPPAPPQPKPAGDAQKKAQPPAPPAPPTPAPRQAAPTNVQPPMPPAAPPKAPPTIADRRIAQLVDRVRQDMSKRFPAINVKINDGAMVPRVDETGFDLELRAEGGTLRDRSEFADFVSSTMQNDPYWREWLKNNGMFVSYNNRPSDAPDTLVPATPTPDELAAMSDLQQTALDEIEQDPELNGAYVESTSLLRPQDGPGKVLQVKGRVADQSQLPRLKTAFESAARSAPKWQPYRNDVAYLYDDVVVGPLNRDRSDRYFSMALEAFWRCDYLRARDAIARAIADDPTSRILQYWQVLLHVRLGEEDRAKRKLAPLLNDDPWGSNGAEIATALERVQGPLRQRLRELEKQVLLSMTP